MRPYKVYIAGRYSRKLEFLPYADQLREMGIECTSSWLKEAYDPNVSIKDLTPEENITVAKQDIEDIIEADTMVFFSEDMNNQPPRGGRHWEMGYASALHLNMFVIGEKENIFHYLPGIKHYPTWADFYEKEIALD